MTHKSFFLCGLFCPEFSYYDCIYISKGDHELLSLLANKKYLLWLLNNLETQLCTISSIINKHFICKTSLEDFLIENPSLTQVFSSHHFNSFHSISDPCQEWFNTSFTPNPYHPENLIHSSISGRKLRSKSEALIDSFLYSAQIPTKYEAPLRLGDRTIYPDFTLFHSATGKLKYWEHFGLMDDPTYRKKASEKIQLYISHEIIPNIDLIITVETKNKPLSIAEIQNAISLFLS